MNKQIHFINAKFNFETIHRYTKIRDKYLIKTNGRWGPRWLHALVFRISTNLGMVGNYIHHESEIIQTDRIRYDDPSLLKNIEECLYLYEVNQPIEIIVGQDNFHDLNMEIGKQAQFIAPVHRSFRQEKEGSLYECELFGVPVRVIPYFSGMAVIPLTKWPDGVSLKVQMVPDQGRYGYEKVRHF